MAEVVEELTAVAGLLAGKPKDPAAEEPITGEIEPESEETPPAPDSEPEPSLKTAPDPAEEPTTMSVKELAEKLDTSAAKIYSDLILNIGGKNISIGELKDRAKELHKADKLLASAEDNALTGGNDLLRRNRELKVAMATLGREPSEMEQREAANRFETYKREQRTLTMQSLPTWDDPTVEATDCKRVGALLSEYGFTPVEIENIFDARQVKMLVDYAAIRSRLADVKLSEVKTTVNQGGKTVRRSAPKKRDVKSLVASGELTQAQGVIALIADGKT